MRWRTDRSPWNLLIAVRYDVRACCSYSPGKSNGEMWSPGDSQDPAAEIIARQPFNTVFMFVLQSSS